MGRIKNKKKKIDLYLDIFDYEKENIQFYNWNKSNIKLLLERVNNIRATSVIVYSASDIAHDLTIADALLDELMRQNITVISIIDKLKIQNKKLYLSKYEKSLFMSVATEQSAKVRYNRASVFESHDIDKRKGVRVAIYCRVSTREQVLGYSIESQKQKNLMYMQLFDYEPEHVECYIDEGQSAKNLKRKELKRMLQDIEDGMIDEIIIYKLDRLSRSVIDTYQLLNMFLDNKINLIAVQDRLDIQTANGRMIVGILAIFAQWERETTMERSNDGQLQMAVEGKYPYPNSPLGYKKDKDKFLTIDENTACIVKDIYQWAKAGCPITEIKDRVKEIYDFDIRIDRIRRIIFEDGYFGEFHFKDYVFTDITPPLVTKEDAIEARQIVRRRAEIYGKEQDKFYFRHKVRCSKCKGLTIGAPTYKRTKRYYYYYCQKCKKRINQEHLEKQIVYDILNRCNTNVKDEHVKAINKNIQKTTTKIKKLTIEYYNNNILEKTYFLSLNILEREMQKEKAKLGEVKLIKGLKWNELTESEKRSIIEKIVLTISVDLERKEVLKIEFNQ